MAGLGDVLRDARTARGASLADAERETKIRARYISALEDDNLVALPGPVYARGFIRNYALYLGLDPDQMLALFEEQSQPTRDKLKAARGGNKVEKTNREATEKISIHPLSPEPVDTRVRYGSSYIAVSLVAIPLMILFYFVYSVWGGSRSTNLPVPTPRPPTLTPLTIPTQLVAEPGTGAFNTPTVAVAVPPAEGNVVAPPLTATVAAQVQPSPAVPAAEQITVKIATTRDAWMRVLVDGVQRYSGTLPSGTTREWTGNRTIRIRTGRADSVKVTVNGADQGLMRIGSDLIVEKEWDRTGAEKIIR